MQIGYWSIPITSSDTNYTTSADPYIPGAWPYLLRALGWAKEHGLHVIIDLHGAPGSQNGYDNSGQRGAAGWAQGNNVARTVDIVKFIAGQIGGMIDVFELLNEPGGWQEDIAHVISDFFEDGYNAVRQAAGDSLKVMIGDAFLGVGVIIGSVYRKSEANSNCALELGWFFGLPGRPRGSDGLRQYSHYFIGMCAHYLLYQHEYQIFNYDQLEMTQDEHLNVSASPNAVICSVSSPPAVLLSSPEHAAQLRQIEPVCG